MHVSLNELEVTVRKAAVGAGLGHGLGEAAGAAAVALAAAGLDPLPPVLAALDGVAAGTAGVPGWDPARRRLTGLTVSALRAGPMVADLVVAEGGMVTVEQVDVPAIIVGVLLAAGVAAEVTWRTPAGAQTRLTLAGGRATGAEGSVEAPHPSGLAEVTVTAVAGDRASMPLPPDGYEVDAALWHELDTLAARCLVRGSEASRLKEAGAGLIDED